MNNKKIINYGIPLSSIIFRIILNSLIFLIIIFIIFTFNFNFYLIGLGIIVLFFILFYSIIQFEKNFQEFRKFILEKMLMIADIRGNETILDLGTGSGFLAVNFGKKIKNGKIIGLDRYNIRYNSYFKKIIYIFKINFFNNNYKQAKLNADLENVGDKCNFISMNLSKIIDFPNEYFDIILSSQFLYCLSINNQINIFKEVDRILKPKGKIIFFESKKFFNWDIKNVYNFYINKGYNIIIDDQFLKEGCILTGQKNI